MFISGDVDGKFLEMSRWGGVKWILELKKRLKDPKYLEAYGYKVYSQNDEDGIIQEIFRRIGTGTKTFVEFGVQNGLESNCHSLLLQGWKGVWIEGSKSSCEQIERRFAPVIKNGKLRVHNQYINRDNIDCIISNFFTEEIDLLSIDVDGNDYYIWKEIKTRPRVVIIEYNGKFTPEIDWHMAYNENHIWDETDYYGASLKSLEILGKEKGYQLVGTNLSGVNAFFVRCDCVADKFPIPPTAENLYNPLRFFMVPHYNGMRSKNYVGNNTEGMEGIFQYYPDWNYLTSFGFYPVEVSGRKRKNLMKERLSSLFIKFIKSSVRKICIHYEISLQKEYLQKQKILGELIIDNSFHVEFSINDVEGIIEIPLMRKYNQNDIVKCDIEIDQLWIPDRIIHNGDHREQGLCLKEIELV